MRPKLRSSFSASVVILSAAALSSCGSRAADGGEAPLPLTLENIFDRAGGAGRAVIAPDGDRVAVVARSQEGGGIRVVPTAAESREAEAEDGTSGEAAPGSRIDGTSPAWSPDGGRLAYLAGGDLRVMTLASRETRPLTEGMTGVRAPSWSPNGSMIAFYSTASEAQDVWIVPSDGASPPRRLTREAAEADDARFTPSWSPDGRWIAYISNGADWWHDDVWGVEVETGRATRISSTLMASSSPIWAPDGASLVLMGTAKDEYWYQDLAYLYRIDLDFDHGVPVATREAPIEMQIHASDFIMRFDPFFSGDGELVYFPYQERGAFDLWAVPAGGGVATRVTNVGGLWTSLHATPDASRIVFTRDAPTEGREAWMIEGEGSLPRRLTDLSASFRDVHRPIEVAFRTFDGLYLQGFLYLPPAIRSSAGESRGAAALLGDAFYGGPACPALVQVHGGGTNSYYQGTNLIEQYLASRGFAVLAINYRGGSGFGREFQDLAVEDWLNDQSKDPGAAADWLRSRRWVNGKVGVYGGSYGGMQTMSAITRTPDKFDAAVPMRGIYSESLTLPYADRLGKIFTITGHGGTPEERPEIYAKSETLDRMDRITAPVLIMHGEHDARAPFENFELAVERLEALGKEYEARTYPEGHGFRDPANSIDMYGRLEAFFTEHLGTCDE